MRKNHKVYKQDFEINKFDLNVIPMDFEILLATCEMCGFQDIFSLIKAPKKTPFF